MKNIYNCNGLPFYDEIDIINREYIINYLTCELKRILKSANRQWDFHRIEAPCMILSEFISPEYADLDVFKVNGPDFGLMLKPETTNSSYQYAMQHKEWSPPFCIWQASKSFRNEQDKTFKNLRFKEFYQLEFQCIYTEGTQMNYLNLLSEELVKSVSSLLNQNTRLIPSDRLPAYSECTLDIEVCTGDESKEAASISLRKDVPFTWNGKQLKNIEVAFGLDRLVYFKA